MIRTRRSTRRREADTSGSSPILHLVHFLYSNDTSGVLLLLLLLVKNVNGECLERVCGGPFYSSKGRFLGEISTGTLVTDFSKAVATFLPRLRGSGTCPDSAEPGVRPAPLSHLSSPTFAERLVCGPSSLVGRCRGWIRQFCSDNGALYVGVMQDWIFYVLVLHLVYVFTLIQVWVPAIQESPKLVEMIRNKPYNYFWCLKVMKRCRGGRLYF